MSDRFGARLIYYFKDGRDIAQMENLFRDLGSICRREGRHERGRCRAAQARARRQRSRHLGHRRPQHARGPARLKRATPPASPIVYAGASDAINNAQRVGDFAESQRVEDAIFALEELRFRGGRRYNYGVVISAMAQSGFDDIDGGDGAPFNPLVPADSRPRSEGRDRRPGAISLSPGVLTMAPHPSGAADAPSVLLISTDHWPAYLMGGAGHGAIRTPTLDSLADAGVRYTNAYAECPVCIPARRTLMTGTTTRTHGDRNFMVQEPMPPVSNACPDLSQRRLSGLRGRQAARLPPARSHRLR